MRRTLRYAFLIAAVIIPTVSDLAQARDAQLSPEYRKWLTEDVRWIISNQERQSFLHQNTDADRDHFVAAFWEQRNPTPGSQPNPFKEEHYRRLAFANQHFAATAPGWKTDRGRVYMLYGPPDSIQTQASSSTTLPEQVWVYRQIQGKAGEVQLKFVDRCRCGDYRLETPMPEIQ
jgi:GWxTD domain-containing protein